MSKRLLIISFSPIHRDPRVLRQVNLFADDFDVTTCGYGTAAEAATDHIQIPDDMTTWRASKRQMLALYASRQYQRLYSGSARVEYCQAQIAARAPFDAVIANDVLALPLATSLGVPVHADLHEYAMGQGTGLAWQLTSQPFLRWAADFMKQCASVSTVAPGIASRYEREFDVPVGVVPNCPRHRDDLGVRATGEPVRLVHVGVGNPERSLDVSVEAVSRVNAESPGTLSLDLYLVPGVASYIEQLRGQAGDPHVTGVQLRDPVEFSQLVDVIHGYDVGVHFVPPVSYNVKHALPNKFFEYVQARVGVLIGPSVEMAPYVDRYGFGVVTPGWGVEDLVSTLRGLTSGAVDGWKTRADAAAWELSAEVTSQLWVDSVNAMAGRTD